MAALTYPTAGRYDTQFLLDGTVPVEGFELEFLGMGELPWPLFRDMVTKLSYDIAEQAISHYLIALDQGKPLVAIPVFPSRFFPQLGTTVNKDSGIETPADLVGKRVAVCGFGYNPAAWMRGILEHYYQLPVKDIIWVADREDPFLAGLNYQPAKGYVVEPIDGLSAELMTAKGIHRVAALEEGRVDALIAPGGGAPTDGNTRRLLNDPASQLGDFVAATGIYPINTVITLRRSTLEANPGLPQALMKAFTQARDRYHHQLATQGAGDHMGVDTPLLEQIGVFPDAYGIEANRTSLEAIIGYCYEQGLIRTRFAVEEIFCL
ncbi:MAG: ABC transporter substrate-binding protein [Gammaproteobacteria bacterium]